MGSCLKSNDELTLGMRNAHDEHKANIDEMIRKASVLADIMKEMQEDRLTSRVDKHGLDEVDASEPQEVDPSSNEFESGIPPEKHGAVRNVERMLATKNSLHEDEPIAMPLSDETSREISKEANDEPQEEKEEVIERYVGDPKPHYSTSQLMSPTQAHFVSLVDRPVRPS